MTTVPVEVPALVAVRVVRCKDCLNWGDKDDSHTPPGRRLCDKPDDGATWEMVGGGYDDSSLYTSPEHYCAAWVPRRARFRGLSFRLSDLSMSGSMLPTTLEWVRCRLREAGMGMAGPFLKP